jgi:hypothetical protein
MWGARTGLALILSVAVVGLQEMVFEGQDALAEVAELLP